MVTKKFEEYCAPFKNLVVERFNFNSVTQGEGETFESFLSRLQTKASTCEFGSLQESLIRDRIIYGIQDKGLQRRLVRETNILLDDCIKYCIATEQSDRQVKLLQGITRVDTVMKKKIRPRNHRANSGETRRNRPAVRK